MPESVQPERVDSEATEASGADSCPRCGAASVNVHGLADCPECSWVGSVDRR